MYEALIYYLLFGFLGWFWERYISGFTLPVCGDTLIQRAGLCIPFLNIWAFGSLILLAVRNYLSTQNTLVLSLIAAILLSIFECISGNLSMLLNNGKKTWNYRDRIYPFCNGFLALDVVAFWFIVSFIYFQWVGPYLDSLIGKG